MYSLHSNQYLIKVCALHFVDGLDILRSTLEVLEVLEELEVLEVLQKYYKMALNLDLLGSTLLTYNFQGYIWNSYYGCKGPPCCKI